MLPNCVCGEEMSFLANSRQHQVYECTCGRIMIRPQGKDERIYYMPEHPGVKLDGQVNKR
jgi:hypothetical protein